ncbi:MAG TPA: carboxypeptidase regulatory-like domain-containing protein, partial [Pyrinomonadaceae bacterium]|nr:carboxypeptidase regulatory-like domain-containing protein [Pyrinomonadaceae bacterium]
MHSWRANVSLTVVAMLTIISGNTIVASGQQGVATATVSGRIDDSSGAAIIGANVTLTNIDKNHTSRSKSDEQGRFTIFYLPVGSYEIKVEQEGFTPISREFSLSVGQALDLSLRLPVSGVVETADVAAGVPVIETVRTEVAETVLSREIESLPLNGRNYLDLAALTPAVSRANPVANQRFAETSAVPGTQISVAGQRNINNGFLLDGLSANDDAADLPGTFFSQEVIREFQVITSGSIAEYGRASAGIVNIATRSGSNEFHSRLYGFLRNQRLDARNPLAPSKDPLTQTQYGGSFGGPLKKDTTFIFGNFEQTRLNNAVVLTILPINVTAINHILDQFSYGGPRITTGLVPAGYTTSNFFVRGDHRINSNNTLALRYSLYDIDGLNSRGVGGLNAVSRGTSLENRDQTLALTETGTLSTRTINELRFQFTRSRLAAPVNDPVGPAVTISGIANLGTSTSSPTARDLDLYELNDNITTIHGAHAFKLGADFLYNRVNITFPGALQGAYTFSSLATLQTGSYITFQQAFGEPRLFQSNPNIGFFAQDEWRVIPDLT